MLNINVGTKQTILTVLNVAESKGITDIRFVRKWLQDSIDSEMLDAKSRMIKSKVSNRRNFKKCPSCGKARMEPWHNEEGLNIVGCKMCRYSEVI